LCILLTLTLLNHIEKFLHESINFLGIEIYRDIIGATVSKSIMNLLKWRNFLGVNDCMVRVRVRFRVRFRVRVTFRWLKKKVS
jgi:hypothetical protein